MTKPRILHLIDDRTAGGVMRYLDFILSDLGMATLATHRVADFSTGLKEEADIIVSHIAVSWRRLPALLRLRAARPHTPLVHVEHSYTKAFTQENVHRTRRFHTLLSTTYALFDRVVAVSEGQARWLREFVRGETLSVIRPVVDLAPFLELPAPDGGPRVIGAIGRLERQKGFDTLIEAMGQSRAGIELRIFGEGAEQRRLEALAHGDRRIRFMGHCDPVAAMGLVDAVAMPSRWEAYGLVALEARAAGRPLLVSHVDGLQDHVAAGAIEVSPGAAAWARALENLEKAPHPIVSRKGAAQSADRLCANWAKLLSGLYLRSEDQEAA